MRGRGDTARPAAVLVFVGMLQVTLSSALITGSWGLPSLGVAGAAMATVLAAGLGGVLLFVLIISGGTIITPAFRLTELRAALFGEILRVGAPSALNNVLTNLSVMVLTGLVGSFGSAALAGYGIGGRLEYLQISVVFGIGSALVTMVGTSIGAGQPRRAEYVAWAGAGIAGMLTGSVGVLAAFHPETWMRFFTGTPEGVVSGAAYSRIAGPAYAFLGLGLGFDFASQGAGRLRWPLLAISARLLIAIAGGWIAIHGEGGGLPTLFDGIAVALVVYGATQASAMAAGAWRQAQRR